MGSFHASRAESERSATQFSGGRGRLPKNFTEKLIVRSAKATAHENAPLVPSVSKKSSSSRQSPKENASHNSSTTTTYTLQGSSSQSPRTLEASSPMQRPIDHAHASATPVTSVQGVTTQTSRPFGEVTTSEENPSEQHEDKRVEYAKSQVFTQRDVYLHCTEKAGLGVFTREPMLKGTVITKFEGNRITALDVDKLKKQKHPSLRYVYQLNKNAFIKGITDPVEDKGLGSFVNNGGKNRQADNNCEFCVINNEVFVRSVRDILAYRELYVPYRCGYSWES